MWIDHEPIVRTASISISMGMSDWIVVRAG